jgi:hypothetical protein
MRSAIPGRAVGGDAFVTVRGRDKKPVGVGKPAFLDPVHPDHEGVSERRSGFGRRADEVRNDGAASLDDAVAEPAHAPGMLHAVFVRKPETAVDVAADLVAIEDDGVEERGEGFGERRLPGAGETMISIFDVMWPHFANLYARRICISGGGASRAPDGGETPPLQAECCGPLRIRRDTGRRRNSTWSADDQHGRSF